MGSIFDGILCDSLVLCLRSLTPVFKSPLGTLALKVSLSSEERVCKQECDVDREIEQDQTDGQKSKVAPEFKFLVSQVRVENQDVKENLHCQLIEDLYLQVFWVL